MKPVIRSFWRSFFTGLLVIFPAIITIAILRVIYGWISGIAIDPLVGVLAPGLPVLPLPLVRVLVVVGFVVIIAGVGFGTRVLIFRRVISWGEAIVRRVPMVGKIYWTVREIANTFSGQRRGFFTEVVLLEWPREGMYALGFVTSESKGEVQERTPDEIINVFVPTTPNPTSGYLVLAPRQSLTRLKMTVEEGMRVVISGGVSGPLVDPFRRPSGK